MEPSGSESSVPSSSSGGGRRSERRPHPSLQPPDYTSTLVQDALRHLATIDLIELSNEAKIELCRAPRDLRSCRRHVQDVLTSCGHASLCAECSQRFDMCPICRTSIPNSGTRLRRRLYYKCIEAGLISKRHDDRFQEKEVNGELVMTDIQRLYSLFDVALENNLVSLICHYVTDVCMDENAISSDPVFAFLLDEVAVKEWCKQTLKNIIQHLCDIYQLDVEGIVSSLSLLQKLASHLVGISNVLETIASSFKDAYAAQLHDLHFLLEKVLKTKQHLEIMIWCSRHHFLQDVPSRFFNLNMWNKDVIERKKAAVARSWPDFLVNLSDLERAQDSTLFIEEALLNLGIEEHYEKKDEELEILCLQDGSSPLIFFYKIDEASGNLCYPFQTLRNAADVLFLHGTSDMVVAKQAIFLYYLFDRQWMRSSTEWRSVVDDFASCFGFTKHSLTECFVFYLLDDHSDQALQEASHLLLEIAGPDTHPKIARVLLERQVPEVALSFLQCSGRDGFNSYDNSGTNFSVNVYLGEAVTAIRVRIECGLLTEAFMSLRMFCSAAKEGKLIGEDLDVCDNPKPDSWVSMVEALVTEMCYLCIRRNLVDRMIELPWNSDEEKYLHKCLFDHACRDPSTIYGSLLVVFYLQRFRYMEAYRINRALLNLEQAAFGSMNEDAASKMRLRSQWRVELVDKGIDLLPDVERQSVKNENLSNNDLTYSDDVQMASVPWMSARISSPAMLNSTLADSPVTPRKDDTYFPLKRMISNASSPTPHEQKEYVSKVPSVLQQRLLSSSVKPKSRVNTADVKGGSPSPSTVPNNLFSNGTNTGVAEWKPGFKEAFRSYDDSIPPKFQLGSRNKALKGLNDSASSIILNDHQFQGDKTNFTPVRSGFLSQSDILHNDMLLDSPTNGSVATKIHDENKTKSGHSGIPDRRNHARISGEANLESLGNQKRDPSLEQGLRSESRWRSGDSSEDEVDYVARRYISTGSTKSTKRRSRTLRR